MNKEQFKQVMTSLGKIGDSESRLCRHMFQPEFFETYHKTFDILLISILKEDWKKDLVTDWLYGWDRQIYFNDKQYDMNCLDKLYEYIFEDKLE